MSERWKPEHDEAYYFFNSVFNVDSEPYKEGFSLDNERIAVGNCFNTKDEAHAAAKKVKALLLSLHEPTTDGSQLVTDCNQLPDWCKVGEWVYLSNEEYDKIESIDGFGINLASGAFVNKKYIHEEAVSARLRKYNAEEMKALVGKVVDKKDGDAFVVTAYTPELDSRKLSAVAIDDMWVTADDVLEYYTINDSPCGKLEHLENGEWVQ